LRSGNTDLGGKRRRQIAPDVLKDGQLVPATVQKAGERCFSRKYVSQRAHADRTLARWLRLAVGEAEQERRKVT
jgi:hypothetical protein